MNRLSILLVIVLALISCGGPVPVPERKLAHCRDNQTGEQFSAWSDTERREGNVRQVTDTQGNIRTYGGNFNMTCRFDRRPLPAPQRR